MYKLNNKIIIVISLILLVLMFVGAYTSGLFSSNKSNSINYNAPSADWVDHYFSIEDLINNSDLVIVGKVEDSIPQQRVNLIFTRQVIKIQKYLKGSSVLNDTIEVLQTGGTLNGITTQEIDDAPLFKIKDHLVLFLKKTDEGHYLVLGGYQGKGKIENNKIKVDESTIEDKVVKELKDKSIDEIEELVKKSK